MQLHVVYYYSVACSGSVYLDHTNETLVIDSTDDSETSKKTSAIVLLTDQAISRSQSES